EQNPVEDVWLQGKNFLRGFWHRLKSFSTVKWLLGTSIYGSQPNIISLKYRVYGEPESGAAPLRLLFRSGSKV
ncbi:MAG: hypothetical protein Q6J74_09785, partial [Gloeomargarita sp. DG02_1_bins_92]